MKTRKKYAKLIGIGSASAFVVIMLCVIVPIIASYGYIATIHPMNQPHDGQIRVACVGDSITYGCGIANRNKNNYPSQLNGLLGGEYCVNNFGYTGRDASYEGTKPYVAEFVYRDSLKFMPNIVVIMLGSNDSNRKNWRGSEPFIKDLTRIVNSYRALESVESVYVMAPPPAFERGGKVGYGIKANIVATEIRAAVKQVADNLQIGFIDLYQTFYGKPELFVDGVHPNAEGAALLASTVYTAIAA